MMDAQFPSHFLKIASVGVGFCGEVWSARDMKKNKVVAIKTLRRKLHSEHGLLYPPLEVQIAPTLLDPQTVAVLEVIEVDDCFFLVQEHLTGGDLFASMNEIGIFSEFLARCCFRDLLEGVKYLHESNVVHRDLKPENCVLDGSGTLKIVDFGLASRFVAGQLLEGFGGSREYAAPELLRETI
jgi:serine/threonine protein kinase